jgi:hypothetical protein
MARDAYKRPLLETQLELLILEEDKNNYLGEFISCMNNTMPTLLSLWV